MLIQLVNYPAQSTGSIVIKEKHQRRIVSEAVTVMKHTCRSFAIGERHQHQQKFEDASVEI